MNGLKHAYVTLEIVVNNKCVLITFKMLTPYYMYLCGLNKNSRYIFEFEIIYTKSQATQLIVNTKMMCEMMSDGCKTSNKAHIITVRTFLMLVIS